MLHSVFVAALLLLSAMTEDTEKIEWTNCSCVNGIYYLLEQDWDYLTGYDDDDVAAAVVPHNDDDETMAINGWKETIVECISHFVHLLRFLWVQHDSPQQLPLTACYSAWQ